MNDWNCEFCDKLRPCGSDGTIVACSMVEPPENSCRMNRVFSIFLLLPEMAMVTCRRKPSRSVCVRRCIEHSKSSARPLRYKKAWRPTVSKQDASRTSTPERKESHVNDGIGSLGRALQAAAKVTCNLTCGVPERESNETKYLREATELIEALQHQLLSGQPMSWAPFRTL